VTFAPSPFRETPCAKKGLFYNYISKKAMKSRFSHSQKVSPRVLLLNAVKDDLEKRRHASLHEAVLASLHPEARSESAGRFWDIDVKIGNRPTVPLSRDITILELFDRIDGKLLILGGSGSGKTTTLLELAESLMIRAESDPNSPIPILVNLATWRENEHAISDWFFLQIQNLYKIPVETSQALMNQKQLLPLLDGLDELEPYRQEFCIQLINEFAEGENAPTNIVVCSCFESYKECETRLRLRAAIWLKPLTEPQIKTYLIAARSRELWYNLESDSNLLNCAKNPLFLNIMTLAYEEILIESWKRIDSTEGKIDYLLNAFIRRQISKEIPTKLYKKGKEPRPDKMRFWLIWLAKRMTQDGDREFSFENISLTWLQTRQQQIMYFNGAKILTGLIWGLITGIIVSLILGLWLGILAAIIAGGIIGNFVRIGAIENFTLLLVLWWHGYIPWNYHRFLNYASQRLLLAEIGRDRYQFMHHILQKHLANM
jgi:NACHT domain